MNYAEFFQEIKSKFAGTDVSDIHEHLAFQFNIEDSEAGGIFYVEVKDSQLHIEPYEYYDRHAIFTASPEVFRKIAEGKVDPVEEFAIHKLKVEGDLDKALKLKEIIARTKKERKKRK
ncbi:MAG: SCP2 sterol-binding domain-containing protein [Lachnospiraceae bacterium]|nr:SCP2 sterol-binding domain-containing protein [Lachnospiraceae bacterium]